MLFVLNQSNPMNGDMHRIPGLFRRWELAEVIRAGQSYQVEAAGHCDDGSPLFALYASTAQPVSSVPE